MCSTGCQGCNNRGGCCWEEEGGSFDQRSFNCSLLLRCFCTSAACKHSENVVFVLVYECLFGVIYWWKGVFIKLNVLCTYVYVVHTAQGGLEQRLNWSERALLTPRAVYTRISFHPHYHQLSRHLHLLADQTNYKVINGSIISTNIVSCCIVVLSLIGWSKPIC